MSDVVNSSSKKSASNTSKPVTSSNAKKNKLSKNAAEAVVLPNILSKYLKERNYSVIPKNISSLAKESSHTMSEMLVADQIQSEISRTNAFTFSNVSCLNNNPTTIDYQFSKLMAFVQSTSTDADLEKLLAPLLCHLFIEMTKGKDWKMASIFLRKYSQAISPVRLNNGHEDHELPAEILSDHKHSFGELIQTLSNVSKKQDIDSIPSIVDFRSCKYKVKLSFTGLALLKQFLARHGHILILQLLSTRFDIEVYSERKEEMEDDGPAPVNLFIKKEPNGLGEGSKEVLVNGFQMSPKVEVKIEDVKVERDEQFYRDGLEEVVNRFRNFNLPINIHVLENVPNISSVSIDKSGCHIAGGFEESHLTIWSVNQFSKQYNGIPHNDLVHPWSNRVACEWHFNRSVEEMNLDDGVPVEMEANTKNVILRGHSKAVTSVLYSVFNPVLLSTSRDCTIRLWTDVNYRCASVLRGHNHPIWCLAESSNGYNLATGSKDTTARLWATDREFPLQVYAGHKQDIDAIDFHPNGNYLATASDDLTIRLWCVTSGKLLRVFTNCKLPAKSLKFSPNGSFLAAAGYETKIRIFDLAAGQQLTEIKNNAPMESICWRSDSKTVAAATTNGIIRLFTIDAATDSSKSYVTNCKRIMQIRANNKATYTCIGIK